MLKDTKQAQEQSQIQSLAASESTEKQKYGLLRPLAYLHFPIPYLPKSEFSNLQNSTSLLDREDPTTVRSQLTFKSSRRTEDIY